MNGLPLEFKLKLKGNHVGYEKSVLNGIMETWHSIDGETYHCILDHPSWYIRHDEKCQYTGLNDRNGKKIYFDDILTHPEHGGLKAKAQIYSGAIGAYDENYNYPYIWTSHQFENMELLKEKNNDIL